MFLKCFHQTSADKETRQQHAEANAFATQKLSSLFGAIQAHSTVPATWRHTVVTPLLKKGDPQLLSNYRLLSVPTVMCRMYCNMWNIRISLWAEANELFSDAQFGFRTHRSTSMAMLALRHISDLPKLLPQQPEVTAAFIDFTAAYDTIPRQRLFTKLAAIGLPASVVDLLRSLYQENHCQIKLNRRLTPPIPTACGLRQGCPLSTVLFNLYIADFSRLLRAAVPGCGVAVGGRRVADISFADDTVLLDTVAGRMQRMLNFLSTYCRENELVINLPKCEIVVFRRPRRHPTQYAWRINGTPVTISELFKYLGVIFHSTKRMHVEAQAHRLQGVRKATAAMRKRAYSLGIGNNMSMFLALYKSIALSGASYGAEVWGTSSTSCPITPADGDQPPRLAPWRAEPLEVEQLAFLKRTLRLPPGATNMIVYAESGFLPLRVTWLARCINFYNRVVALKSPLIHACLTHNIALCAPHSWAAEFMAGLNSYVPSVDWCAELSACKPVDCGSVMQAVWSMFSSFWEGIPDTPEQPECVGRPSATYKKFAMQGEGLEVGRAASHLYHNISFNKQRVLTRFRASCFPLAANLGRRQNTPYAERICTRCGQAAVDNEHHVLFDCPAFHDLRTALLPTELLWNGPDYWDLWSYIWHCHRQLSHERDNMTCSALCESRVCEILVLTRSCFPQCSGQSRPYGHWTPCNSVQFSPGASEFACV